MRYYSLISIAALQLMFGVQTKVSRSDFGQKWPLKHYCEIDSIWLPGEPVWIKDAKTGKRTYYGPSKKNFGILIQQGLQLCS
jgi:hypothetical protein